MFFRNKKNKKAFLIISLYCNTFLLILTAYCQDTSFLDRKGSFKDKEIKLSLSDAVFLSLRNNRDIRSLNLERVADKFDLKVAEDKFFPDIEVYGDSYLNYTEDISSNSGLSSEIKENKQDIGIKLIEKVPFGGQFTFSWGGEKQRQDLQGSVINKTGNLWKASFIQPILKGGGIDVNTASVKIARLNDQINILNLKSTVISTITATIKAYRSFIQAIRQVEINSISLTRAKKLLETNKILIDSGRMAEVEIIQAKADIAAKEFTLESSKNDMENARLSLLKVLDIDKYTNIIPVKEGDILELKPDFENCLKIALENRTDYLTGLLNIKLAEIDLVLAKNNKLYDLSFAASYQKDETGDDEDDLGTEQWQVGLELNIPLYGDLTREQTLIRAKILLEQLNIQLEELNDNIEIEIKDAIRNIKIKLNQVKLAIKARELSELKLEVEQEKLKAGRSNNFQIVTFQNDLIYAQNSEVEAKTAYRNALTDMDAVLGSAFDTWKIDFNSYLKDTK